jgi:hypothetical protein
MRIDLFSLEDSLKSKSTSSNSPMSYAMQVILIRVLQISQKPHSKHSERFDRTDLPCGERLGRKWRVDGHPKFCGCWWLREYRMYLFTHRPTPYGLRHVLQQVTRYKITCIDTLDDDSAHNAILPPRRRLLVWPTLLQLAAPKTTTIVKHWWWDRE